MQSGFLRHQDDHAALLGAEAAVRDAFFLSRLGSCRAAGKGVGRGGHWQRLPLYCLDLRKTVPNTFSVRHLFLCSLLAFLLPNGGPPPVAARTVVVTAASCLEDSHDHLNLFPDRGAGLIARIMNLGPILLADVRELGLLLVGQV